MPVFAHAILKLDFDGNQHIKQCRYIASPVYSGELRLGLMPGKLNTGDL
jgi:hypothetical protein